MISQIHGYNILNTFLTYWRKKNKVFWVGGVGWFINHINTPFALPFLHKAACLFLNPLQCFFLKFSTYRNIESNKKRAKFDLLPLTFYLSLSQRRQKSSEIVRIKKKPEKIIKINTLAFAEKSISFFLGSAFFSGLVAE